MSVDLPWEDGEPPALAMLVVPLPTEPVSLVAEVGLPIPESGLFMGGEVALGLGARLGMEWGPLLLLGLGAYADTELG